MYLHSGSRCPTQCNAADYNENRAVPIDPNAACGNHEHESQLSFVAPSEMPMTKAKLLLLALTLAAGTSASACDNDRDVRLDESPPLVIEEPANLLGSGDKTRVAALPEYATCGNVAPEGMVLQQLRSVDTRCRQAGNSAGLNLIGQ